MKYLFGKTRLAVSATVGSLVIALAVAAPQAWANGASGMDEAALERKVQQLEDQLNAIQNEMDQVKSDAAQEKQHVLEVEDKDKLAKILGQQYHAVVGNPPYIIVKDKRTEKEEGNCSKNGKSGQGPVED